MTRRLVMGTAGHIDHGKTRLIEMLTGVNCDRLPEEKKRGITIELGFTHLELPSGATLGVVDVPGHERFVRAMVAGAGGIDFVMLVIAADESVMPQTREHLAICRLLGIGRGLVALTKADLVDEDLLTLAQADVAELTAGTFLEGAPVVPVSAITGQGRDELLATIETVAGATGGRSDTGIFRLPIDRVFTVKGFGTVVTGTCVGGRLAVGDAVDIMPAATRARVRNLQVHGQNVETAFAGQRVAVNLPGIETAQIGRGAILTTPDTLPPTWMIDAEIEVLAGAPRPLKRRSLVRLHSFTREVMARVVPLEGEAIEPGKTGLAQLRLNEPAIVLPGDRFVLRSYSPVATIGGGAVINSVPHKHRAPYAAALADLATLRDGTLNERLAVHFRQAGRQGLRFAQLGPLLGASEKELREAWLKMLSARQLMRVAIEPETALETAAFTSLREDLRTRLETFHREHPSLPGLGRAELLGLPAKGAPPKVVARALQSLAAENVVAIEGESVRLATHNATADADLQREIDRVAALAREAGLSAPTRFDLAKKTPDEDLLDRALAMLLREGRLVRVGAMLVYDAAALAAAEAAVVAYLDEHHAIDAQGFKTLFGLSRKFVIPLAEYLDARKVTMRVGDQRVARKKS